MRTRTLTALTISTTCLLGTSTAAAQDAPRADVPTTAPQERVRPASRGVSGLSPRAEFNQLLQRRTQLTRELATLDASAADAVLKGEEPVALYARQTAAQEQLDLTELRLQILAVRHGLVLPDVEPLPADREAAAEQAAEVARERGRSYLRVGESRTRVALQERVTRLLGTLDFDAFLASAETDAAAVSHAASADAR